MTSQSGAGVFAGRARLRPFTAVTDSVARYLPGNVAAFARRNYRWELSALTLWPFAQTMVEGAVTATIATRAFPDTPAWVTATLSAAPNFSNITSFMWARMASGRDTVRHLNWIQAGIVLLVGIIACLPLNHVGMILFVASAVVARLLMTGVVTLRAILWRANYDRTERASITGQLITVQTVVIVSCSLLLGIAMDADERAYRVIYPLAVLAGMGGIWMFSKVRMRRPFLNDPSRAEVESHDGGSGFIIGELAAEWARAVRKIAVVLRDDVPYRGFMVCMFIMGIGNLAIDGPLIRLLKEDFQLGYLGGLLLVQALPLALMPLAIPFWARLLDNAHIIRFRAIHSWSFVIGQSLMFVGAHLGALWIIVLAQVFQGIGYGGGSLAWNIGHNDFATRDKAGLYMTVHMTLNGIRGFLGPYVGMALYTGVPIAGMRVFDIGSYCFLFWAFFCLLGALGFVYLDRKYTSITRRRPESD